MAPALFIDGRNCIYRAVFANQNSLINNRYHSFVVMLRFMCSWLNKHNPSSVHVFWDAPRETVWRRKILADYKEHRPSMVDIKDELNNTQNVAINVFKSLNIRQYQLDSMEADDLIYAACKTSYPEEIIIISSDRDYIQIPYYMPNVKLYEPQRNVFLQAPKFNPVTQKALMGDKADHICGYKGIGPKKSAIIVETLKNTNQFLNTNDRKLFFRNLLLIDLSLCPRLLANQSYVIKILASDINYDKKAILEIASVFKVNGLMQEYERIVFPFKALNKDIKEEIGG